MHAFLRGPHGPVSFNAALGALALASILVSCATLAGCRVSDEPASCPDGNCASCANYRQCQTRLVKCRCDECNCRGGCECQSQSIPFATADWSDNPVVNLPEHARCKNYAGGSCVIASTVSLFRWQGRDDLADLFRRSYSGGQSAGSLHAKLEANRVRFAYTTSGDVAFLEWAIRTRRGAGITFFSNHFICLVDLNHDRAVLLDNNRVGQYITLPREEFIRRWRGFGGWATTPVYSPAPPTARR